NGRKDVPVGRMKRREQKKFVYTPYWTNNKGFTYISVLLSFLIIFTTLPLLVFFYLFLITLLKKLRFPFHNFFILFKKINIVRCHSMFMKTEFIINERKQIKKSKSLLNNINHLFVKKLRVKGMKFIYGM